MVELEILFSSGQGILVPMEDRESALRFMQRAMDYDPDAKSGLFHLSTPYEEVLLDLGDISFIRLKKENYPRIGATLKIPAQTSFWDQSQQAQQAQQEQQAQQQQQGSQQGTHYASREEHEEAIKHRRDAEKSGDERTFMVDPSGNVNTRTTDSYGRAEERLRQAEARMDKMDAQRKKVEAELRKTAEELEDAVKEAELKKKMEQLEIDKEIERMKEKKHD